MLQEGLKNLDVGFDFDDDNDIILSGEICGGNPFCTSMITIDELRDVIKSGYISFDKLFYYFKKEYTAGDDESYVDYHDSFFGGAVISVGNYYGNQSHSEIEIDRDGIIRKAGSMYFVQVLKEKGVKVKLDNINN